MAGLTSFTPVGVETREPKINDAGSASSEDQRQFLSRILSTPTLRQTALSGVTDEALRNLLGQILPSNTGPLNGQIGAANQALLSTLEPGSVRTPRQTTDGVAQGNYEIPAPPFELTAPNRVGNASKSVQQIQREVETLFGYPEGLGYGAVAPRSNKSDHPHGRALDIMVHGRGGDTAPTAQEKAWGDRHVQYLLANRERLNIKYIIWNGEIWTSRGTREPFAGSGGNGYGGPHRNHIHVSVTQ